MNVCWKQTVFVQCKDCLSIILSQSIKQRIGEAWNGFFFTSQNIIILSWMSDDVSFATQEVVNQFLLLLLFSSLAQVTWELNWLSEERNQSWESHCIGNHNWCLSDVLRCLREEVCEKTPPQQNENMLQWTDSFSESNGIQCEWNESIFCLWCGCESTIDLNSIYSQILQTNWSQDWWLCESSHWKNSVIGCLKECDKGF